MKRLITKYIPILFTALTLSATGCRRGLDDWRAVGELSFVVERNDDLTVKGGQVDNEIPYRIDVVDDAGNTVAHYDDHREITSIKLSEGTYRVYAEDNMADEPGNRFGRPRYQGSQSVVVRSGQVSQVVLICRLKNVKVQVNFDETIRKRLKNYKLYIQPEENSPADERLEFDQAAIDAGQNVGWVQQTENGRFLLRFLAANEQEPDRLLEYRRVIADAEAGDFYRFTIRMDENGSASSGGNVFRLTVRTDLAEYSFPLAVMEPTRALPVVRRDDGGSISDPISTNEDNRDGNGKVRIEAEAGFERIRIRHEDPAVLLRYGLPGMVTLGGDNSAATDEEQRQRLAGVIAWGAGTDADGRACVVGEQEMWIDFSPLMNIREVDGAKLPGKPGRYDIDIEIYDADRQMRTQRITLAVARDFATGGALANSLVDGVPGVGAKYAYVSASWLNVRPAGLAFQYRKKFGTGADGAWQTVAVDEALVNEATKTFVGLLRGLEPETTYEFRPVGDGVDAGTIETFVTEPYVAVPNLDFEYGYTKNTGSGIGKAENVWMVNIPGEPEYWGTGNAGTKNGNALKVNVTTQETSVVVSGNALKLESRVGSTFIGDVFAAGNLFSGYFQELNGMPSTDHETQKGYVHFGRPFAGRPLALRGWYRYKSTPIDDKTKGVNIPSELQGEPDQCHIYISLENWGGSSTRPLGYKNPSFEDASVVGFGEMHTEGEVNMSDYERFEIPVRYKEGAARPTHIVIVATSSRWGADFFGGSGSTLYIDDFELLWDPTELAAQ